MKFNIPLLTDNQEKRVLYIPKFFGESDIDLTKNSTPFDATTKGPKAYFQAHSVAEKEDNAFDALKSEMEKQNVITRDVTAASSLLSIKESEKLTVDGTAEDLLDDSVEINQTPG